MKNALWFLMGVVGGFVIAHLVNKDPRGHELLAEVDARIGEFTDRIGDAYREQEARLSDVVDAARDAASEVVANASEALETAKDAASDALGTAKDAASDALGTRRAPLPTSSIRPPTPPRSSPTDFSAPRPLEGSRRSCIEESHTYEDRRDRPALPRLLREERPRHRAVGVARQRRPDAAVHGGRHGAVHPVSDRRRSRAASRASPTCRSASEPTTSKRSERPRATAPSSRCSATGRSATTSRKARSATRGSS